MPPPRLYIDAPLGPAICVSLNAEQASYLTRVLRLGLGAEVRLFNGRDGEWKAAIESLTKRETTLVCLEHTRPQSAGPDAWLLFAPVKRQATDWIVEKATELGVSAIQPVLTRRTNAETVRIDRLVAIAREAAEQCERLDAPEICAPKPLETLLTGWPGDRALLFADEAGVERWPDGAPPPRFATLIGPEGGFANEERAALRRLNFVRPISLGPRILRAETAAVAALTLMMNAWGDWRAP